MHVCVGGGSVCGGNDRERDVYMCGGGVGVLMHVFAKGWDENSANYICAY